METVVIVTMTALLLVAGIVITLLMEERSNLKERLRLMPDEHRIYLRCSICGRFCKYPQATKLYSSEELIQVWCPNCSVPKKEKKDVKPMEP